MTAWVKKLPLERNGSLDALDAALASGVLRADEVVAVIGKTPGNGGVNDESRVLADRTVRALLVRHGTRSPAEVDTLPLVWSGGCDGVLSPHATVFGDDGRAHDGLRLGTAMSEPILPEEVGRPAMIEKVAAAIANAIRAAGVRDASDVAFVQVKSPLLTIDSIADAHRRGRRTVTDKPNESLPRSSGAAALGVALALGEIGELPSEEQIGADHDLWSSVASCSSGAERPEAQIILFANASGAPQRHGVAVGTAVMRDSLDVDAMWAAVRASGLSLPDRPRAEDLENRVVNLFVKCDPHPSGRLRGRVQTMLDDSEISYHHHIKAAVGALAASVIGDPAVFVSSAALHQGPLGGGIVAAVVDLG